MLLPNVQWCPWIVSVSVDERASAIVLMSSELQRAP